MTSEVFSIASRFRGPPGSGNGGYVCGRVAVHLPGCAAVRLKAPPPLESELRIEVSEAGALLMHGTNVIAEGRAAELDLAIPAIPALSEAQEAAKSFPGFKHHVFPQCFVCGPQRAPGDGLRIFPGPLANRSVVAAPWTPEPSLGDGAGRLRPEFLWAALDCTSAFAVLPIPEGKAIVLGELCARIDGAVSPEETCVVVGWPLQTDGRKRLAGSAVVSSSGRPVAVARATWIEVPASAFAGQ
jgi:hypothetical protein